ncbi:nucleotidyltransferase family protein [Candidatus Woesearchaeota archaeon]|nr:nucleotidyltransferase family protein [Candidatus Woesearchaeota archaeon]
MRKNKKKEVIEKLKPKIIEILKKNNIKRAGIFGSYARGEQKKNSDIDILVEPAKNMGFKFAGLEIQLTKALRKKVDLVSYNGISNYLKEKILSQEIRII